jgi:hypothetical protein
MINGQKNNVILYNLQSMLLISRNRKNKIMNRGIVVVVSDYQFNIFYKDLYIKFKS